MVLNDLLRSQMSCDLLSMLDDGLFFEAKYTIRGCNLPDYEMYHTLSCAIPSRDNWRLVIESPDELFSLTNKSVLEANKIGEYANFRNNVEPNDVLSLALSIEKKESDLIITIYSFDKFVQALLSKNPLDVMSFFSRTMKCKEFVTFEVLDKDILISTSTMLFTNASSDNVRNFNRKKRLHDCQLLSYFNSGNGIELLPDDFHIENEPTNNPLRSLFEKLESFLSLLYISNTASIEGGFLKCMISGHRNLNFDVKLDLSDIVNAELFHIYSWIFTDGNVADKALIARNILSLHCRYNSILRVDESIFSTILANFSLYLKDNVQSYLELKNKLSEFICNVVCQIGERSTELLDSMKKNIFAVFGFLLTVVLANVVSERPLDNIFTSDVCLVLEGILLGSLVYLVICIYESTYKLEKTKKGYETLKNNYNDVFSDKELNEIFKNDVELKNAVKHINKNMIIFTSIWALGIIIGFITVSVKFISNLNH